MKDIVEKLRYGVDDDPWASETMTEAADEIEQLRSDTVVLDKAVLELRRERDGLRTALEKISTSTGVAAVPIARAALTYQQSPNAKE